MTVVVAPVNSIASSDWPKVRPRRLSWSMNTAPAMVVTAAGCGEVLLVAALPDPGIVVVHPMIDQERLPASAGIESEASASHTHNRSHWRMGRPSGSDGAILPGGRSENVARCAWNVSSLPTGGGAQRRGGVLREGSGKSRGFQRRLDVHRVDQRGDMLRVHVRRQPVAEVEHMALARTAVAVAVGVERGPACARIASGFAYSAAGSRFCSDLLRARGARRRRGRWSSPRPRLRRRCPRVLQVRRVALAEQDQRGYRVPGPRLCPSACDLQQVPQRELRYIAGDSTPPQVSNTCNACAPAGSCAPR